MLSNKIKAQLLILVTFLLGIVVGAAGFYVVSRRNQGTSPTSASLVLLEDLTKTLNLTPEQKNQVEEILRQSRQEYQEIRTQTRPQFNAARDRMRERIKNILSPEQQTKYETWNKDQDARREQQRARDDSSRR